MNEMKEKLIKESTENILGVKILNGDILIRNVIRECMKLTNPTDAEKIRSHFGE